MRGRIGIRQDHLDTNQIPEYIGKSARVALGHLNWGTVTVNASTQVGDFMLLVIQTDDPYTPDSTYYAGLGWTYYNTRKYGTTCRGTVFYKFNDGDTTFDLDPIQDHQTVVVMTFRHVNTTSPINAYREGDWGNGASPSTSDGGGGSGQLIPGITTTVDSCFFMVIMYHCYPTASSYVDNGSWVNANIDGGTELVDYSTTLGYDGGMAIWGGGKLTAGACGSTNVDMNRTNYNGPYMVLALAPG